MKTIFTKIIFLFFALFAVTFKTESRIISVVTDTDGYTFTLDTGLMKIKVCSSDIIEVKYTTLGSFDNKKSLVTINPWTTVPVFSMSKQNNSFIITTGRLQIAVDSLTNSVSFSDHSGNVVLAEDHKLAKTMKATTIAGINTYTCTSTFLSPANEALFGLGCHPNDDGKMNYKGRNQDMAIQYMTGAIPVLLSTKGYGLMWDNYAASNFYGTVASNTKYSYVSESGTMVDYYFFYGPEFDQIISSYRNTTGVAPMFPKWAFGLFQSQDRYKSQAEVLSVKNKYRKNKLPVDCIVQDWYYWEPNVIGSHVMDPVRYPDPKALVDSLHEANIHGMISIWPVFAQGTNNYNELKDSGGLTSIIWNDVMTHNPDTYYDTHNPKARNIYWRQAKNSLIAPYGWDAWWVDQCEPDNGGDFDQRRKTDFYLGKGIDYFNSYSLMHSEGLYKHWREDIPGKRAFFLIRQAWAGQQRNSIALWSSDITCTWASYKNQVPQGINACVSGIPYWTSDIGGYHYNWTAPDWSTPANREMFTRWFQFGAFSPIFRIHGKGERAMFSDNWDSSTKTILLYYDNLRYRLMPYLYSLSWKVTNENYTIMRALAFDFRTDPSIVNIPDQYMFGPAFLVSPVTAQLYSNSSSSTVKTRKVYLPKSNTWYDFWTGESFPGGQSLDVEVPIEKIPLFVKAGSIIPMGPFIQYSTEKEPDTIELRVFTGDNGKFTIYEDENDNYNYEKGKYTEIPIEYNDATKQLTIGNRTGSYDDLPHNKTFNIVWVKKGYGYGLDSPVKCDTSVSYTGSQIVVPFSQNGIQASNADIFESPDFLVAPNPAKDKIDITLNMNASDNVQIKLFNLEGKCIYSADSLFKIGKNSYCIDVKGINPAPGIYIVNIYAGNINLSKKVNLL